EEKPIVREIVVAAVVGLFFKPINQQPPPLISLAKIDRPVHGLHSAVRQPFFAGIKKGKSSLFAINAFEKAKSAGGLVVVLPCGLLIHKGSYSANCLSGLVLKDPPDALSMPECL